MRFVCCVLAHSVRWIFHCVQTLEIVQAINRCYWCLDKMPFHTKHNLINEQYLFQLNACLIRQRISYSIKPRRDFYLWIVFTISVEFRVQFYIKAIFLVLQNTQSTIVSFHSKQKLIFYTMFYLIGIIYCRDLIFKRFKNFECEFERSYTENYIIRKMEGSKRRMNGKWD